MVVVWGFGFFHSDDREVERERERETKMRGKRDIIIANIYIYILLRYIILMCWIGI